MAGCCDPRGCDRFFSPKFARRVADKYRRKGLDSTAQEIVDFVVSRGVQGATVLEVGGGVGEIQIELLKHGAARTVNLELSPGYEEEAERLLQENDLAGRSERLLHDLATEPEAVEPVDVVVLQRVVCCYPDYERLLTAAAGRARRLLVFSYPRRNAVSRTFVTLQNLLFALLRREFRTFTHPPERMLAVLEGAGLRRTHAHEPLVWQVAGLERPAA